MALTPTPPARGKTLQPWTWLELLVIMVSAIMIGVPLMLEITRWTMPQRVPAQTSSSVPTGNDLRLGLAGNWGSAYIGDVVRLTLATANDHPDAAMSEVTVALTLPPSLELVGAEADRGSGVLSGPGGVSYGPFNLESGDTSRLTVDVRIAENAQSGSVLVTQGQASFSGADGDSFSNIATVLVLGAAPTARATEVPSATAEPSATALPTATTEPSATAAPTTEPSATAAPTTEPSATAAPTTEPSTAAGTGAAPQSGATSRPNATEQPTAGTVISGGSTTGAPAAASAVASPVATTGNSGSAPSAPAAATSAPAAPSPQAAGGASQSDSALVVPTPLLNPTSVPQATTGSQPLPVAAAPAASQPAAATGTSLPETSAGIPLTGLLLLGGTLLTRTVRLHRARERV